MQHYRLLRNNKESGPYTWKELAHLPLKPYDLVWADGKSAAWRYPSELPEFRDIAPAVEEDFYQQYHLKSEKIPAPAGPRSTSVPAPEKGSNQKKNISVILPNRSNAPIPEPVLRMVQKAKETRQTEFNAPVFDEAPVPATLREPVMTVNAPEIDQLKIPSVKKHRNKNLRLPILIAGICLLSASIWWMNKPTGGPATSSIQPVKKLPAENAAPVIQTGLSDEAEPTEEFTSDILPLPGNPALEFAALKRHLSVQPQHINVGMFGGINRLQLLVKNSHSAPLAAIQIAVDFLEKDQTLLHTEIVEIKSINAGASLSVRVPANGKGRAVQTRVIAIGDLRP